MKAIRPRGRTVDCRRNQSRPYQVSGLFPEIVFISVIHVLFPYSSFAGFGGFRCLMPVADNCK